MSGHRSPPTSSTPHSRHSSRHSVSYLPIPQAPESLAFPDSALEQEAVEFLHGFVHPHSHHSEETPSQHDHDSEEDVVSDHDLDLRRRLPWWKRPSAVWVLAMIPFVMAATGMTIAPRIEIVTQLVCRTLRSSAGPDRAVFNETTPDFSLCSSDPVVQAAAATFLIAMTTISGVLSCLTTAAWASRSDRKGRVSTMRICMVGLLLTDLVFIFVYRAFGKFPESYRLLIVGPILEGLLGGMSAASANIHAYIADCTEPEKRSRTFSLYLGLLFTGIAVGPTLGSLVIRYTHEVISAFDVAFAMHLLYTFVVWFIVPESLFPRQLARARRDYANSKAATSVATRFSLRRLFIFLAPLRIFVPAYTDNSRPSKRRLDWNLTLLSAAYCFAIMMMGTYPYKFQYASLKFGWNSEILGYWMSVMGITRAIFLMVILPTIISLFRPKPKASVQSYTGPSEESSPTYEVPSTQSEREPLQPAEASVDSTHGHRHNSPVFDLNIARTSLIIEITAYILMGIATSGPVFTVWTAMGSCGAGFTPAVQSLSLALYISRGGTESGSLFGALSVMTALGGHIISPALFGFTYAATVGTFPQAIFLICAVAMSCSLVLVSFVRLPKPVVSATNQDEEDLDGETPIDPANRKIPKIIVVDTTQEG